ncbi:MAG TPA: LLM class F420-dependent oxidoreductase [Microthrixaceae bacterium]|nr:LLM class F420-dependent oxidoreductase [Microthrixaceae bacterium]
MRFGLTIFATDISMDLTELAIEAESRGFDSLWIPEHTHIPISRVTAPPTGDQELAEEYKRSLDPLVALAFAAAATSTLRLGTGVMLPMQREPIVTAKAIATLQNMSGGRFELGIGFGWNRDEMADHGVDYATRRAHSREHMLAMQALWENEEGSFDGEFVKIPPSWSWPKPEKKVPVLIGGGAGPKMFAHIAEYGDGWIPIGGAGLADDIPRFRQAVEDAGRDPANMRVIPFGTLPSPGKLEHFESIGVDECVFRIPSATRDVVMRTLEEQTELLESLKESNHS